MMLDVKSIGLEPRLQERYQTLVEEHLHTNQSVASGANPLPSGASSFASTMGAWRFYRNPSVTLPQLAQPLVEEGRQALREHCQRYGLVVHDESHLNYNFHQRKRDRIRLSHSHDWGYDLRSSLLVSDVNGAPLAPVCQQVVAASGVHSTRAAEPLSRRAYVDELAEEMAHVEGLKLGRPLVHLVDAEGDAADLHRQWTKYLHLVRAKGRQQVQHEGQTKLLSQVAEQLKVQGALQYCRDIEFEGHPAQQFVAETQVTITRYGRTKRKEGRKVKYRYIPGPPVTLRLVVSEVRSAEGKVLALWLLLSNVDSQIPAEQLALWYYWRWRIESFFKLLKSAGHEVEHWQQETALAVAKRLLVASMACVFVWQLARDPSPQAEELRGLLVRLSGRHMKRQKPWTAPALLNGVWVLLAMLEVLQEYDLSHLRDLAEKCLRFVT
jgi:hypothetical protein